MRSAGWRGLGDHVGVKCVCFLLAIAERALEARAKRRRDALAAAPTQASLDHDAPVRRHVEFVPSRDLGPLLFGVGRLDIAVHHPPVKGIFRCISTSKRRRRCAPRSSHCRYIESSRSAGEGSNDISYSPSSG